MKRFFLCFLFFILLSCAKDPVRIVYNDKKVYSKNNYASENYNRGKYRTSPDGKVVRDISYKDSDSKVIGEKGYKYITVKQDDSLFQIALENDMTLTEIAEINDLQEPYNIKVGQKIKVYNSGTKTENKLVVNDGNTNTNKNKYHVVAQGESLYSISKSYNTTMDEIVKNNNLEKPYSIIVGQKLLITGGENNQSIAIKKETPKDKQESNVAVKTQTKVEQKESGDFLWPIKGDILVKFGDKVKETYHDGVNIKGNSGDPIKSSKSGEVAYAGNELKGYGNIIILRHSNNWLSVYAYCNELKVKVGDKVKQGDVIATVGNTGSFSDPQLYFSIREGREAKDPLKLLK